MATKKILCIGGAGQLGVHVVKSLLPYSVTNVDFNANPNSHSNIILQKGSSAAENNNYVLKQLEGAKTTFDSIIVTAGGWTGGNIKDDDYL